MKLLFCIEADWEGSAKKQSSILPMLQCISGIYPSKIKYIFRTANTTAEFKYCLKKFKQISKTNDDFCGLFICGHGKPGVIHLGDDSLSIEQLAEISTEIGEKLYSGHLIHFDSCSIIKGTKSQIKKFIKLTGASCVTGFEDEVDFIESLALEMIFIDCLSDNNNASDAVEKFLKEHKSICNRTKFKVIDMSHSLPSP
ncbi:MAG: hypothetical protein JL50_17605 [Peptococcaceae bacterium BICA1-7]|nr:MAG: hypothetical protein JL50_17605 [Peptococcaceae bacterium BICA1-7]HBV98635.1 hypothetical protein [Desulfotomaculum sp.]